MISVKSGIAQKGCTPSDYGASMKFSGSIFNMNKRNDYCRQHKGNQNSLTQDTVVAQRINELEEQLKSS